MKMKLVIIGLVSSTAVGLTFWQMQKANHNDELYAIDSGIEIARAKQAVHNQSLKLISETGEVIRGGNSYFQSGDHEKAAEYYTKALGMDPNSRTFVGFKLIETYEKMKRYDDALLILNQIESPKWSEYGHEKAARIRSQLLAAKAQAGQTSQAQ